MNICVTYNKQNYPIAAFAKLADALDSVRDYVDESWSKPVRVEEQYNCINKVVYLARNFPGKCVPFQTLAQAFTWSNIKSSKQNIETCISHSSRNCWQIDTLYRAFSIYKLKVQ